MFCLRYSDLRLIVINQCFDTKTDDTEHHNPENYPGQKSATGIVNQLQVCGLMDPR